MIKLSPLLTPLFSERTPTTTQLETRHLLPQLPLHPVLNPRKPVLNPHLNLVVLSLVLNPILSGESHQRLVLADFLVEPYLLDLMAHARPGFR